MKSLKDDPYQYGCGPHAKFLSHYGSEKKKSVVRQPMKSHGRQVGCRPHVYMPQQREKFEPIRRTNCGELLDMSSGDVQPARYHKDVIANMNCEFACPYGETLRIHWHHAIRTKLADALRKLKYTVYEEVHGTADNGSNRRIDIIAISETLSQGMIIDPTIRFETYKGQPEDVHEEKRAIYVPTIPYYKDKYQLHDISVTGLMFGARGTIPNFSSQFCKTLGLHKSFLNELALLIIRESVKLLRNLVYGL
ncbi:hypothetical protein ANN_08581 [Periplaneta americana]|uniref:Uncharacterized protein n=1 Tax=Periplaneta americana TaxID=6978 RepID=A0ABQ8T1T5_PERAM|nr:hypothetical protein ANN_08581 [Periplaneta americana]